MALVLRLAAAGVAFLTPARGLLADLAPGERPVGEAVGLTAGLLAFFLEGQRVRAMGGGTGADRRALVALGLLLGVVPLSLGLRARDDLASTTLGYVAVPLAVLVALAPLGTLGALRPLGRLTPLTLLSGALAMGAAILLPSTPRLADTVTNAFIVFLLVSFFELRRAGGASLRTTKLFGIHQFQLYFMLTVVTFLTLPTHPWAGFLALTAAVTLYLHLYLRGVP